MGISVYTSVVVGVELNKREQRAFDKCVSSKNCFAIFMDFVENFLKTRKPHYSLSALLKRERKRVVKPYVPFWSKYSKRTTESMRSGKFLEYYRKHLKNIDEKEKDPFDFFIMPTGWEDEPENIIGTRVGKEEHGREVDWCLATLFECTSENKNIKIPGTRPWETGTAKFKNGKWYTHNGENAFRCPVSDIPDNVFKLIYGFKGSRKTYIQKKKAAWFKLCKGEKPYYDYRNELWGYSRPNFEIADAWFEFLAGQVGLRYDHMRLEKYVCFCWR